jgi:hypothetical protein
LSLDNVLNSQNIFYEELEMASGRMCKWTQNSLERFWELAQEVEPDATPTT